MSPAPKRKTTRTSTTPARRPAPSRPSVPQHDVLYDVWLWVRWPLLVSVLLYMALVAYRIPAVGDQQKTAQAVAEIESQHITLGDVMGENLPFVPYAPNNDATVAGIDANNNGIRDDVELAIFKLHPDSAKIRAAELQYAMELQNELNGNVFNSETWVAASKSEGRGDGCIVDLAFSSSSTTQIQISTSEEWGKEVQNLVFNTSIRSAKLNQNSGYETAFTTGTKNDCDIDLSSLPN